MPIYEYECQSCNEKFELQRKFSDPKVETCPVCNKGPVEKLISQSSFALKGSGWYKSDYSSGSAKPSCAAASEGKPACAGCPSAQ